MCIRDSLLFLYLATFPYQKGLNNPNELTRLYTSYALAEHQQFNIDSVLQEWGHVGDLSSRDGKTYSPKAPFQSWVGVPLIWIFSQNKSGKGFSEPPRALLRLLRILGSGIFVFAFIFVLFSRWGVRTSKKEQAGLVLIFGLGTMLFPYGILFTGHALGASLAGVSFVLAAQLAEFDRPRPFLSGLAGCTAAFASFSDYPSALLAVPAVFLIAHASIKKNVSTVLQHGIAGVALSLIHI